jgi:hypothetical protein
VDKWIIGHTIVTSQPMGFETNTVTLLFDAEVTLLFSIEERQNEERTPSMIDFCSS